MPDAASPVRANTMANPASGLEQNHLSPVRRQAWPSPSLVPSLFASVAVAATSEPVRTVDGEPAYLRNAPDNWVSIGNAPNTYVNQEVFSRTGESLGTVKDVLMGPEGRPAAVIVTVGRALGIGDKDVGLRFSALRIEQRDAGPRIIVGVEKETLQAAPIFEWTQAPKQ